MLGGELCPGGDISPQTAISGASPRRASRFPALSWALNDVYRSEWRRGRADETYSLKPLRNHSDPRSISGA